MLKVNVLLTGVTYISMDNFYSSFREVMKENEEVISMLIGALILGSWLGMIIGLFIFR